ncbi:hypothetical protein HHK36_007822 [Tetracentron sinense]|uniref:Protein kinase domain-containing protein n=1 Tax=Tetracentron sinense TaxID=13715 RepID=A0A834ZHY2_TETSI|nr:hypothetical protein HHK36_007822 [Tetracentron sinense]
MGCDNLAYITSDGDIVGGCMSICSNASTRVSGCNGISCCQTSIPPNLQAFDIRISTFKNATADCKNTFLVDQNWFIRKLSSNFHAVQDMGYVPVVLDWRIANLTCPPHPWQKYYNASYRSTDYRSTNSSFNYCDCGWGFRGNPYLDDGCLGIGIGVGILFILLVSLWLYRIVKKKKNFKLKQKFFKQNGGLLLQQQMSSNEGSIEKTKIFTARELEKATDNFNEIRILGQGGNGTVYKGMLVDGRIVAVKKSKMVDESQIEQFINEVAILSQINHRNVVKLLGCCLETEVPLLVYEFISNGTLLDHIHDQNEEFPILWTDRLRIATEVAGAVAYLHSAASIPIYHRDIKSTNILLDDKRRAKVSDFGTSRSVPTDKTHLTTLVQGTFGYLDPEYFQSSQFTEKSDVYSFGVVLVELLTGQRPISSTRSQEEKSLAIHFLSSIKENRLFDIFDTRVVQEGGKEELIAVADLAKRCLNLNGKKRPTMKEVSMELEGVRMSEGNFSIQLNPQEIECYIPETSSLWDAYSMSTGYASLENSAALSLDVQPLLPNPSG